MNGQTQDGDDTDYADENSKSHILRHNAGLSSCYDSRMATRRFRTYRWMLMAAILVVELATNIQAQSSTVTVTQTDFSFVDRGGVSRTADGTGNDVIVGYGRIQPNARNTNAAGVAIFGYRNNGTLISEVGVPATRPIVRGRIYAATLGTNIGLAAGRTGVAFVNPNDQDASVSFFFTDAAGFDFGSGVTSIPARGQISRFLSETPFNGSSRAITFSFTSDVPLAATALRGLVNERGEFLMSSLPVIDISLPPVHETVVIPYYAAGAGWTTQAFLVNPTDSQISFTVNLLTADGLPRSNNPSPLISISARSAVIVGAGSPPSLLTGSMQIIPSEGGAAPSAVAIFAYRPSDTTVTAASALGVSAPALRMYVEDTQATKTGVAVTNPSSSPATVTFDLTGFDGSSLTSTSVLIPGNGELAEFISDIFSPQIIAKPLYGVLRITTTASAVSAVGLRGRYNERGDFLITTIPAISEAVPAASDDLFFPEIVNGGGFATQFVLFSGAAGQQSSGTVKFVNQDSTPMGVNWRVYRIGPVVGPPAIVRRVEPQYTDAARQARIQGTVRMSAVIHEDGSLSITAILQSLGFGLDESSQTALEQWRFVPPITSNGDPAAITLTVEVNFNLG
jgi:TonB family protein